MQVVEALSADEWELVTSDAFVPLTCTAFERDFRGRIEHEALDDTISVNHVTTDGLAVHRTERQAQHANSDDIHITLQLASHGVVRQDGRETRVAAGSVSTYATDRAYRLDYTAPGQRQTLVQVSKRSLGIPVEMVDRACERLLVPDGAASGVFFDFVEETRGAAEGDPDVAETARDLAATMIRSSFTSGRALPTTHGGMLATVRAFMRGNLHEASLDVAGIADAHFVSRRYLYELFAPLDETPGEHLRRLRLHRAADLLVDPAAARLTVADVAARSGFSDATTFTRAFSREFGMLPREFRSGS